MSDESKRRTIGRIENFYGGVAVKQKGGLYFWALDDYSGMDWQEIPKTLYDELVKFDDSQKGDPDGT